MRERLAQRCKVREDTGPFDDDLLLCMNAGEGQKTEEESDREFLHGEALSLRLIGESSLIPRKTYMLENK